jgi:hypothetical protein
MRRGVPQGADLTSTRGTIISGRIRRSRCGTERIVAQLAKSMQGNISPLPRFILLSNQEETNMKLTTVLLATAFALSNSFAIAQSGGAGGAASGTGGGAAGVSGGSVGGSGTTGSSGSTMSGSGSSTGSTAGSANGPNSTMNPSGSTVGPSSSPSGSTLTPTGPGSGTAR